MIHRHLRGEDLVREPHIRLPTEFIEPAEAGDEQGEQAARAEPPAIPVESRRKNFTEVEMALSAQQAHAEARRCLRCDLAFTQPPPPEENPCAAVEGASA